MPAPELRSRFAERFPFLPARYRVEHPLVPVVRLSGVIGSGIPLRPGLSMATCASALERAFGYKRARAVAIVVNSPGGSPVQSHLIFSRIRALADEKKLPVLVFVEDAAASGGYMIACAGDEIFADPSSLVGSIGVVSAGFGLDRLIERFGIERRVHTAGRHKAMLDPFRPEQAEDVERLKAIQARVHDTFVGLVKSRRGSRLQDAPETLFSGAVWVGDEAVELGLVDGIGDLRSVLHERFGGKVDLRQVPVGRQSWLARWFRRNGAASVHSPALVDPTRVIGALNEESAWRRLGL
jgi:signal peptide peptidase SppA